MRKVKIFMHIEYSFHCLFFYFESLCFCGWMAVHLFTVNFVLAMFYMSCLCLLLQFEGKMAVFL